METLPNENKQLIYNDLLAQFRAFEDPNESDPDLIDRNAKIRSALTVLSSVAFLNTQRPLDEEEKKNWEDSLKEVTKHFPKVNE